MIWRLLFLVIYIIFFLIRSSNNGKQSNPHPSNIERLNLALQREGKLSMYSRSILSLIMVLSILVYVVYPSWLQIFALPIPIWLRSIGFCSAILSLPFLYWAHRSLGQQYSPHLELQEEHQLIDNGLYRVIRHPMYTFLIIFMLSISIFAANSIILLPHLMAISLVLLRLDKEEAMLIDQFGDMYREYMFKTGRLLPKFIH